MTKRIRKAAPKGATHYNPQTDSYYRAVDGGMWDYYSIYTGWVGVQIDPVQPMFISLTKPPIVDTLWAVAAVLIVVGIMTLVTAYKAHS